VAQESSVTYDHANRFPSLVAGAFTIEAIAQQLTDAATEAMPGGDGDLDAVERSVELLASAVARMRATLEESVTLAV
jgi:uncharacterized protein involved in exopolysaccharide biosynthesis